MFKLLLIVSTHSSYGQHKLTLSGYMVGCCEAFGFFAARDVGEAMRIEQAHPGIRSGPGAAVKSSIAGCPLQASCRGFFLLPCGSADGSVAAAAASPR